MKTIEISVRSKIPRVTSELKTLVADNSEYRLDFTFDEEWTEGPKTVFLIVEGVEALAPITMTGDTVKVPPIRITDGSHHQIAVGVQQGDLLTTRPVRLVIYPSAESALMSSLVNDDDVNMTWLEWVNNSIAASVNNLAREYSPEETYEIEDCVLSGKTLYRCIVPIRRPEPWDPSHWEAVKIADELTASKVLSKRVAGEGSILIPDGAETRLDALGVRAEYTQDAADENGVREIHPATAASVNVNGREFTVHVPAGVWGGTLDMVSGKLAKDRVYLQLDGAEAWSKTSQGASSYFAMRIGDFGSVVEGSGICSHFEEAPIASGNTVTGTHVINSATFAEARLIVRPEGVADMTVEQFAAWLAAQAQNGTPVQVLYTVTAPEEITVEVPEVSLSNGFTVISSENGVYADCGISHEAYADAEGIRYAFVPLSGYNVEVGGLDSSTGAGRTTSTRARTRVSSYYTGLWLTEGSVIAAPGFRFSVFAYRSDIADASVYKGMEFSLEERNPYAVPEDGYYRILLAKPDNTAFTDEDLTAAAAALRVFRKETETTRAADGIAQEDIIPTLVITGDVSGFDAPNPNGDKLKVSDLHYAFEGFAAGPEGTCSLKWQGSSSLRYEKKNYTLTLDAKFDAWRYWLMNKNGYFAHTGNISRVTVPEVSRWGMQKKYCLKANWIDPSMARNIVCARLWGQVVASRQTSGVVSALAQDDPRLSAPNYGAIDGFPVRIRLNGEDIGLFTLNIPKDPWLFGMSDGETEWVVGGESNAKSACGWKDLAVEDTEAAGFGDDFAVEVGEDFVDQNNISLPIHSINTAIAAALDYDKGWERSMAYRLDVDSVFDYFIFTCCVNNHDALRKNILYGTYNGAKWFLSAYDMDTTFGSDPYGTGWFDVVNDRNQFAEAASMHRLAELAYIYSREKLRARYKELRRTVLSDENVWHEFSQFFADMPENAYRSNEGRWPRENGTSLAVISQYMDYYRMHCKYLDEELDADESAAEILKDAASALVGTAEGNPAVCDNAAGERHFRALTAEIGMTQSGSGTPSTTNVRKITGTLSATVKHGGGNQYTGESDTEGKVLDPFGEEVSGNGVVSGFIPLDGMDRIYYRLPAGDAGGMLTVQFYGQDQAVPAIPATMIAFLPGDTISRSPTINAAFMRVSVNGTRGLDGFEAVGFRKSETVTVYFPEEAGEVCGGVLDLAGGQLTVTKGYRRLDGTEAWQKMGTVRPYFYLNIGAGGTVIDDSGICSHFAPAEISTSNAETGQRITNSGANYARLLIRPEGYADMSLEDFTAWLAEQAAANRAVQIVYTLAQPLEYAIGPRNFTTQPGTNCVTADCGDVSAEFVLDTEKALAGGMGVSPTAEVTKSGHTATITITDKNGTTEAQITSPTAEVTRSEKNVTITVTDEDGTTSQTLADNTVLQKDAASAIPGSASGDPAIFADGAADRNLRAVTVEAVPVQSGSGTPSESNIRRITGRTGASVKVFGGNLYDEETSAAGYTLSSSGMPVETEGMKLSEFIPVGGVEMIWFSGRRTSGSGMISTKIAAYDENEGFLATVYTGTASEDVIAGTCMTMDAAFIRIATAEAVEDLLVADYHTEEAASVTFPDAAGTVYGAVLDLSAGKLAVDTAYRAFDGTEEWFVAGSNRYFYLDVGEYGSVVNDSGVCSHFAPAQIGGSNTEIGQRVVNSSANMARVVIRPTEYIGVTADQFKAWLAGQAQNGTPVQIAYKITAPTVYDIAPRDLGQFRGVNAVKADCGAVSVEYVRETETVLDGIRAMIAGAEAGFAATKDYAAGEFLIVGGAFYKVTAAITDGDPLVPGTNVTQTTVGAELAVAERGGGVMPISPTASVTKTGHTATITITDAGGTTTAQISDGEDGQDGTNGTDGADGADGTTFTPAVSSAGVISWTNDGGKTNPQSVDLVAAVIAALPSAVGVSF